MTSQKTGLNSEVLINTLKNGGVVVIPTDTIYGLSCLALSQKSVERVYKLRKRNPKKPFIILIARLEQLSFFGIKLDKKTKKIISKFWPGKVSVILPCPSRQFFYLHRGTKTLAFRLPKKINLRRLLKKTGPLISTSVNPEGGKPAKNIKEAKIYFGDKVDFYMNGDKLESLPSTLVAIKNNRLIVKRQGAVKIK